MTKYLDNSFRAEIFLYALYSYIISLQRILLTIVFIKLLQVRKCAIFVVGNILKQQKRPHKKVQIDLEDDPKLPGDRPANLWLCYDPLKAPKSEADWNEPRYVHKTHYGYYKWPPKMEVYAASSEQPLLQRSLEDMNPGEQEVFKFFSNSSKVEKLIGK